MNVKAEIQKAEAAIHAATVRALQDLYDATELLPASIEVQMFDASTIGKQETIVGRVKIKGGI